MADRLIRALAADGTLRICLIEGTVLVREARRIHALSRVASAALGRQLLMTAMLTADLKNDTDCLSTIIKGDGPAGSMICTGWPVCRVKGRLQHGDIELPPTADGKLNVGTFVGANGSLTVIRDLSLRQPYVGSSHLVSGEIAEDFTQYLAASQQQPSLVYLGVRVQADTGEICAAGGMLVQAMPGCADETLDEATALGERIAGFSEALANGTDAAAFLLETFGGLSPEILDCREPLYQCDCSRERIERALLSVGRDELMDMAERDGGAELCCDFCHTRYVFTGEELLALMRDADERANDDGE